VRLRACPLPARCRCPKASVRGLGDSLARPVRRPESWRRCVRDRRRFRCPPRRAAWRRRFAALRRCPEGRRRSVAFRCSASRASAGAGPLPRKGCCLGFHSRRWTLSPPPCPDPRVGSGCGVAARSGRCPAAFGFPSEEGHLRTAGWHPVEAARLPRGVPPRWSAVWPLAGCLERGVGARAVAARPRGGGWLGPGRCFAVRRPPRRGWPLGPAGRPPPKRRLAAVPSLPASEEVGVAGPPVTAEPDRPEERCQLVCAGGRPPSEEGGYASG
jgi:hypothetical protein